MLTPTYKLHLKLPFQGRLAEMDKSEMSVLVATRHLIKWRGTEFPYSRLGSWSYLQTLDLTRKAFREKHSSLLPLQKLLLHWALNWTCNWITSISEPIEGTSYKEGKFQKKFLKLWKILFDFSALATKISTQSKTARYTHLNWHEKRSRLMWVLLLACTINPLMTVNVAVS